MQITTKRLYDNKKMITSIILLAWPAVVEQALERGLPELERFYGLGK
jgi:hypothetical protein